MTRELWSKLKAYFKVNFLNDKNEEKSASCLKNEVTISYDNNPNNRFKGIISHLGEGKSKNVVDEGKNRRSSIFSFSYHPRNAVDYKNLDSEYCTNNLSDQWICIDFKDRKVKPTNYSVRSHASQSNWFNVQSWCIEGSNDGNSWETLDTRNGEKSLDGLNASNTFSISNHSDSVNFYKYLRLRQTGENTNCNNVLILTGLELFGIIKE